MTKQRRFTQEFEDEAVRLAATSGRTQREIAEDLGVGLSTLLRWIGRSRDRLVETPDQAPQADMAAELKHLRRKNEILRQERDVLKRATAFLTGREIDEVSTHQSGEEGFLGPPPLPGSWRQPERLFRLKDRPAADASATTW